MKAFKKWQDNREVKTIGYLTNAGAYKAGEEAGWRAALEQVMRWGMHHYGNDFLTDLSALSQEIQQELADDSPISS